MGIGGDRWGSVGIWWGSDGDLVGIVGDPVGIRHLVFSFEELPIPVPK